MKKSIALPAAALLAMVSFSTSQPAAAAPETELIHHYTLDGTLADEVSPVVLQPASDAPAHYVADAPSGRAKSVLFGSDTEKANSRLNFPMAVRLPNGAGTISMWFKAPDYTTPPQGARYILKVPGQEHSDYDPAKPSGCYLTLFGPEGSIGCILGGGAALRGEVPDLSKWNHLAVTWSDEGKTARLYLNGNQAAEGEILGVLQSKIYSIRVGGFGNIPEHDPSETQFQGMLSDFRIYEGELSEAEIAKLANPR